MLNKNHLAGVVAAARWLTLALCALAPLATRADEAPVALSPLRVSGYGTVAYAWDNRSALAPIRDLTQRPDHGAATGASWKLDSRIGLHFDYRVTADSEVVVQAMARDQVATGAGSALELAYLGLRPGDDLRLRVGRVGFDAFLMSDHRNLGFAYPWVRPPREFYSWIPIFAVDGADLTREFPGGDVRWRLRAQAGNAKVVIPLGSDSFAFRGKPVWALSLQGDTGAWRLKTSVSRLVSRAEAAPLDALHRGLDQLAALAPGAIRDEAAKLRRETAFKGTRVNYFTLGAAYDDGDWVGQAEFGHSRASAAVATAGNTAYAVLGRRVGRFTPYGMVSASRPGRNILSAENDWAVIGQSAFQTAAYAVANSTRQDQRTLAFGVRWDVDPRAAIKLQWDRSHIRPHGYVLWFRTPDNEARASTVRMLTLSLDFIF